MHQIIKSSPELKVHLDGFHHQRLSENIQRWWATFGSGRLYITHLVYLFTPKLIVLDQ